MLVVMAGLPGSGKSTIARGIARGLRAALVSVDPIDAALRRAGVDRDQPTGLAAYLAAEAVADDVLTAGVHVVIDAVNAAPPAREQWRRLAARHGAELRVVEVVCSDVALHRRRLADRYRELAGLPEPTWDDVLRRRAGYAPWDEPRTVLDTATASPAVLVDRALDVIAARDAG